MGNRGPIGVEGSFGLPGQRGPIGLPGMPGEKV